MLLLFKNSKIIRSIRCEQWDLGKNKLNSFSTTCYTIFKTYTLAQSSGSVMPMECVFCRCNAHCGSCKHFSFLGESTNAIPHYHKLCSWVSCISGNCRGQHTHSAMDEAHPEKTSLMIKVSPLPGYCKHDSTGASCFATTASSRVGVKTDWGHLLV